MTRIENHNSKTVCWFLMISVLQVALNDLQTAGPVMQDDFSILLRFRPHRYVVTGDKAKMYHQRKVLSEGRNLQRIGAITLTNH